MLINRMQLQQAQQALLELNQAKLPLKAAYSLTKAARLLQQELNAIERFRHNLVVELGVQSEDGSIKVAEDKEAQFQAAMVDHISQAAEIPLLLTPLSSLGNVELSAVVLQACIGVILFDDFDTATEVQEVPAAGNAGETPHLKVVK